MDNLGFVKLYVLWMPPEYSQDKIIYWWNRLVYIFEVHVQEILLKHTNQFKLIMENVCSFEDSFIYRIIYIICVDYFLPVQQKVWERQL